MSLEKKVTSPLMILIGIVAGGETKTATVNHFKTDDPDALNTRFMEYLANLRQKGTSHGTVGMAASGSKFAFALKQAATNRQPVLGMLWATEDKPFYVTVSDVGVRGSVITGKIVSSYFPDVIITLEIDVYTYSASKYNAILHGEFPRREDGNNEPHEAGRLAQEPALENA